VCDLGLSRFELKYSAGAPAHDKLMHSIALYGRKVVIPLVRDMACLRLLRCRQADDLLFLRRSRNCELTLLAQQWG
jgi:hypothetical protein